MVDFEAGQRLLADHTAALLGEIPPDRGVAIMVTMPSQAADDYTLVQHLVEHGMDCMRINCAHDDDGRWARMVAHLRRAEGGNRPEVSGAHGPGRAQTPHGPPRTRSAPWSKSSRRATRSDA